MPPRQLDQNARLTLAAGVELTASQRDRLDAAGFDLVADATTSPEQLLGVIDQVEVWFGGHLDADLLAQAKQLWWLQAETAGLDHHMFPELAASKVVVTAVRGKHVSLSEQAMAFVLAFARALPLMAAQQARRQWRQPTQQELKGVMGSRMVVLGTGRLAQDLAAKAAAFGIRVDGVNHNGAAAPGFDQVFHQDHLATAVQAAQWVVAVLPMTPETAGLVSAEVIANMAPGAVFINVGRGGVVDQTALTAALAQGRLAGAGLDVFAQEPLPPDDPLWAMPNVLITPHSAGQIAGLPGHEAGFECLIENLARLRRGEELDGVADKQAGF